MTTVSGKLLSVGLRSAAVFPLDSTGNPVCTGAVTSGSVAATTGYDFTGEKAFALTIPEPRRIAHVGSDRLLAVDVLPPTTEISGTMNAAANDYALNAVLQGVTETTVGEALALNYATDMQGSEPDVSLFLYQQAQDALTKVRRWRAWLVPLAKCIPIPPGMEDNPSEVKYSLVASPSAKTIWGEDLTSGSYGCTESALMEIMCEGKPALEVFQGGATSPTTLVLSGTPKTAAKLSVFKNGTKLATPAGYTLAGKNITLVAGIAATNFVWVLYEK